MNAPLDHPSYRIADSRLELFDALEESWAMPSARAADASHSSLLRVSTIGGIAIASAAIAENFIPAALGLMAGMMLTVGLASVWSLFL